MSLFLCIVWGCVLTSLIYMQLSSFLSTSDWRDCHFSTIYSCLLCQRDVWVCFWVLYSVPLILVCFGDDSTLFWLLSLCSTVWSLRGLCFQLCSLTLKMALAILDLLWFPINFRIICFSFVKNVILWVDRDRIICPLFCEVTLTVLSLPIQKHGGIFPFLWIILKILDTVLKDITLTSTTERGRGGAVKEQRCWYVI